MFIKFVHFVLIYAYSSIVFNVVGFSFILYCRLTYLDYMVREDFLFFCLLFKVFHYYMGVYTFAWFI